MAISAVAALVSTATGVATGTTLAFGATLFGAGASAFAMAASHFLVTTAIGAAINALSPKPSGGSTATNRGYQTSGKGAALDHAIIYGKVRVGGAVVFEEATGENNKFLHQVIAFAGHEIESFDGIYLNGELLTIDGSGNVTSPSHYSGKVRVKTHLGTSDQTADTNLVNEVNDWTTNHRLRGVAYTYIRYVFDSDSFPSGIPAVTAEIKGKKLYDPRTDTTEWSDNPALAVRDYITTSTYGLGEGTDAIDDTLVNLAANKCDATDTINGQPWFTCNGSFVTSTTPYDLLIDLLASMGGLLWYGQGKWRMRAAQWLEPVVEYTVDDLRGPIQVKTRHSRRDNFNTIKGTFRGPESDWQPTDYPAVTNSAFVAADGGQESVANFDLAFTDNSEEARRLSRISLERNRQQITVDIVTSLKGMDNQVGDVIWLSIDRYGWETKPFEIISWTLDIGENLETVVVMSLRETSESVFDEVDDGVIYERDNTTLLSPFDVPDIGLNISAIAQILDEKVVNSATILVESLRPEGIDSVEIQMKQLTEINSSGVEVSVPDLGFITLGVGRLGSFEAQDVKRGTWKIRVVATNTFGIKGIPTLVDVLLNSFDAKPSDVTGFTRQIAGSTLFLSWNPIPDRDLGYYEIKYNSSTTGATWDNSQPLITRVARPATSATVIVRSGTYLIRPWDKLGQPSDSPTTLTVLPSEVPTLSTVVELPQHPTFDGTKVGTQVEIAYDPDRLVPDTLNLSNGDGSRGTYYMDDGTGLDYVDTGATRNISVNSQATVHRYQPDAGVWDNIPQMWDTWPNVFDTWTNETATFGDYYYELEISTTGDDPSGSPTWSAWFQLGTGTVVARAVRMRVNLYSPNIGVGPAFEELTFIVEY